MIDIDYGFYTDEYKGNAIKSAAEFSAAAEKAGAYVDRVTFGRIDEPEKIHKMAVCAVCDVIYKFPDSNIVSENNDGYSVRYADDLHSKERAMYEAVRDFLPADILYRGF